MNAQVPPPTNTEGTPLDQVTSVAFLSLNELDRDVFRGGVLVTDSRGKPTEFRCTSPIQPNNVQKTLYGATLRTHIAVELTGRPLLSALKEKPHVVLVNQDLFLELRPFIGWPVLLVTKQGETMTLPEETGNKIKRELLPNPSGKFDPVILTCHWQYENDIRSFASPLRVLSAAMDFTEPFSRIANALKLVHEKGAVASA
jgi:hypothetical protein